MIYNNICVCVYLCMHMCVCSKYLLDKSVQPKVCADHKALGMLMSWAASDSRSQLTKGLHIHYPFDPHNKPGGRSLFFFR